VQDAMQRYFDTDGEPQYVGKAADGRDVYVGFHPHAEPGSVFLRPRHPFAAAGPYMRPGYGGYGYGYSPFSPAGYALPIMGGALLGGGLLGGAMLGGGMF